MTISLLGVLARPSSKVSMYMKAKKRPAAEKKCQMSWLSYMSKKTHSAKYFVKANSYERMFEN